MTPSVGIRGAGVAGLSLARALLRRAPNIRITIFDRRPRLPHPTRTFCFFDDGRLPSGIKPDHAWASVRFSGRGFSRVVSCEGAPYSLVRGESFFGGALAELEQHGVELRWECGSVELEPGAVRVGSERTEFGLVVDAAFAPEGQRPILWQSFAGLWVRSQSDCFDPQEALLMDLGESSSDAPVSFVYVLPTSRRSALIEHTTFSQERLPAERHLTAAHAWAAERGLPQLVVEETEAGSIPMGLPFKINRAGPLQVGSAAGAIRAATGYAFQSILRQAEGVAEEVASRVVRGGQGAFAAPETTPPWMRFGDTLFLKTLARAPLQGSVLMERLLSRAPDRQLLSFLGGSASLLDALRVMRCVPKGPMLRTLCLG